MSSFIFAQNTKFSTGTLKAVPVQKEINTLPGSIKAVMDSLHYDAVNDDAIGTGGAADFGVYAFFPTDSLQPLATAGYSILSVKVYINGASTVTATQLRIYADTTTPLYTQDFTPIEGWNEVYLTTPMTVPSTGNLYIGYNVTCTGGYPAGCDAGPVAAGGNGNWMYFGGDWAHLTELSSALTYNWNIRAMIGTVPTTPLAICTPNSYDAGNVNVSQSATSGNFTLSNIGAGTLTCTGITGLSAPWTTTLVPASVSLAAGASTTFTFTYAPSAVGVNNQTVVIATNGGDITITLAGEAVECNTISSFPWVESFESATFPPVCWTKASPDGGTGWAQIADGTTPLPGWTGGTMTIPTGGGANAAYCTWSTGGTSSNDQWLITPQIAVQANQELSYYVFWNGGYYDQLDVKVSTTTNAEASFTTTLLSSDTTSFMADDWVKLSIPLTAYASQNVYFAFNEHVLNNTDDGAFIGLDLVTVDVATSIVENGNYTINVFPNPANDRLYIDAENVKQVNVFNVLGNLVAEYGSVNAINTSDLNNGAYIIVVITETNVSKSMINIVH